MKNPIFFLVNKYHQKWFIDVPMANVGYIRSGKFLSFLESNHPTQGIDAANAAVKPGEIDYVTRSRIEVTDRGGLER